jgi:hypothetical protein
MRQEFRAAAQGLLPVCDVFDEKAARLEIITQHGGESRLVVDQQDTRLVEI